MGIKDCTSLFEKLTRKNKIDRAIKNFDKMTTEEFQRELGIVDLGSGEVGDKKYYKNKYHKEETRKDIDILKDDDFDFQQLTDDDLL